MGYAVPIVSHGGGSMRVYSGMRRQRGAGFFQTIARIALPIIRKLFPFLKRAVANVGKRVAKSALNVGSSVAGDLLRGNVKNIPKTFKKKSREEINALSNQYLNTNVFPDEEEDDDGGGQTGSGRRRRRGYKRKAINKKKKKKSCKRRKTCILSPSDRI